MCPALLTVLGGFVVCPARPANRPNMVRPVSLQGTFLMVRCALLTDPSTSMRMKGIRRRHTRPEILLRRLMWSLGLRYRCNDDRLPGSPDIVNRTNRWAIFVHGCYWHGHPGCKRATMPKRNAEFWAAKIESNRRRDAAKVEALRRLEFEVVVVWECEVYRMARFGVEHAPPDLLRLMRRLTGAGESRTS